MWYCLCDVILQKAQDILKKGATTEYDAVDGYLHQGVLDEIRATIKADMIRTHPELIRCISVHSNDDFPLAPSEEAVADANKRFHHELHLKERPLWTHFAVLVKTGLEYSRIESLLQKYAYFIWKGPWAQLWCRFGYDPRKDPSALQYQTVEMNFRNLVKVPDPESLEDVRDSNSMPPETLYQFRLDHIPRLRFMTYCLCDVKLPRAQQMLSKMEAFPAYDLKYGFLKEGQLQSVWWQINGEMKRTYPEMTHGVTVRLNDEFPTAPGLGDLNDIFMSDELRTKMEDIFKERPLWTRFAVSVKSRIGRKQLYYILPKFAFYIFDGPWGRLWCRFGYDPRTDPSAAQYQSLRMDFALLNEAPDKQYSEREQFESLHARFHYRPGQRTPLCGVVYSLCDIVLPEVQEIMRRNTTTEYNAYTGYIHAGTLSQIEALISDDVEKVQHGTEAPSHIVHSEDEFPMAPSVEAVQEADKSFHRDLHVRMVGIFEERPLWTRYAVFIRTGVGRAEIDDLLQKFAFFIKDGPWGRLWCRYGYDPRKDPSAVRFQTLQIKFSSTITGIEEQQRLERQRVVDNTPPCAQCRSGKLPPLPEMWYSFCDVLLPHVQWIVRRNTTTEYNASNGHCKQGTVESIRRLVAVDFQMTQPEITIEGTEESAVALTGG